jgi:8-amino-7-oxononanoate synthase
MAALDFLGARLIDLEHQGRLRDARPARASWVACSNDYLGFASEDEDAWGAGASRLVSGDEPVHRELEGEAARWVELPAALAFTSGYAANVGLVSSLAGREDLVVSDALNHASLIDGARLSRATVQVTPHLDVDAVTAALRARPSGRRAFVVTESYFSMDADTPDLRALATSCAEHGAALVVDEAHALGVFGPDGAGLCRRAAVVPDALVGTFGKAIGTQGAFVAGPEVLRAWLWNTARSFVFSTGMSPRLARASLAALERAQRAAPERESLASRAKHLRAGLKKLGLEPLGHGPIVPVIFGAEGEALRVAQGLAAEGIHAQAIRPPTVPAGTARIRLTVRASDTVPELDALLGALARLV